MESEGWRELCWQLFGLKGRKRKKTSFLDSLGGEGEREERKEWGWCKNSLSLC